jgi:uncharacterized protein with PQ loop repeat
MIYEDEKFNKKMATVAWVSSSIVFNIFLIYGVYISKVVRTANGETPPWIAVAIFDLVVMFLLRICVRDRFK